jgi:RNase P subunit RPR2
MHKCDVCEQLTVPRTPPEARMYGSDSEFVNCTTCDTKYRYQGGCRYIILNDEQLKLLREYHSTK